MRRLILAAALAVLSSRADAAPPPAPPPGAAPDLTPPQMAAEEMMNLFNDICLARFPNEDAVGMAVAARKAVPLPAAASKAALLGRSGAAWAVPSGNGHYVLAVEMPPRHCVVTGPAAEDDGVRTVFGMVVTSFAKGKEFGALAQPPVREGKVNGQDATIQIIAAAPQGRPRQAFVNMSMANADGTTTLRLTRELDVK